MSFVVVGLSHRTSPVELRERFAFAGEKIPAALQTLRDSGVATEAAILSTCNRVEVYVATTLPAETAFAELKKFLIAHHADIFGYGRQFLHDKVLRQIGILILVNHKVSELMLILIQHIGIFLKQLVSFVQQVVKIHCAGPKPAVNVGFIYLA